MKTSLTCHCGHRILQRDVMCQGYYVRQFGPSYVYIKYRCSHCKKLGQHYVKQEEWDDALLAEIATEASQPERTRFERLGKITLEEMRDFHMALDNMASIPNPMSEDQER